MHFMSVSSHVQARRERVLKRMENQNPGMNIFDFKLPASKVKLQASCNYKKENESFVSQLNTLQK